MFQLINQLTVMCTTRDELTTDGDYYADPRVVQDYSTDPRVVKDSGKGDIGIYTIRGC